MNEFKRGEETTVYFIFKGTPFAVTIRFTGQLDIVDSVEYGIFERVNDPLVASGELSTARTYSLSKERVSSMTAERVEADVW